MPSHKHETDLDFLLYPAVGGIKLIKPVDNKTQYQALMRIEHLLKMPMYVYFLNCESVIQNINEETVKVAGYLSVKDAINKTVDVATTKEAANFSKAHDREVISKKCVIVKEENYIRRVDQVKLHVVSVKLPWYDKDNNIIGVFGCSFVPGIHNMAKSIQTMIEIGLFTKTNSCFDHLLNEQSVSAPLSKQEIKCLKLLVRGYTAKLIAMQLKLSNRTVEHYVENIKHKFNVYTKTELICKAIELGFSPREGKS